MRQNGGDIAYGTVATEAECCGACLATPGCAAGDFNRASKMRPTWDGQVRNQRDEVQVDWTGLRRLFSAGGGGGQGHGGTCHLKAANVPKPGQQVVDRISSPLLMSPPLLLFSFEQTLSPYLNQHTLFALHELAG